MTSLSSKTENKHHTKFHLSEDIIDRCTAFITFTYITSAAYTAKKDRLRHTEGRTQMKYFIMMKSSTLAMRAQRVAKGMKINTVYTKRTDKQGCHFGLDTDYDAEKLCRMLSLHGIECVRIQRTGDKR